MESAFRKPLKQSLRKSFFFLTVPRVHFRLLQYSVQVGANPFVTLPFHLAHGSFHFFLPNFFSFFWKLISLLCQAFLRPLSLPQLKHSVPVQPPPRLCCFQIPEVTFCVDSYHPQAVTLFCSFKHHYSFLRHMNSSSN